MLSPGCGSMSSTAQTIRGGTCGTGMASDCQITQRPRPRGRRAPRWCPRLCIVTIKVGVLGAHGRVGSEVCRAVDRADDLQLVAAVGSGETLDSLAVADVVVDFTRPDVVLDNLRWCIARGRHVVVGTSGFDDARLDEVRAALAHSPRVGVLVAPNFSI